MWSIACYPSYTPEGGVPRARRIFRRYLPAEILTYLIINFLWAGLSLWLVSTLVSPTQRRDSDGFSYAHIAAYNDRPQILATLIKAAGADATALVNRSNVGDWTAMHFAVREGSIEMVQTLIRAGADVHPRNGMGHTALEVAVVNRKRRLYPLLLAVGATIPPNTTNAYLRKVAAAGGFKAYEKAHRQALVALAAKCFPRLPVDAVSHVVAFAFHVGYY